LSLLSVRTRHPYFGEPNRHSKSCPTRHQHFGVPMRRSESVHRLSACIFGAESDTDSDSDLLLFGGYPTQHPHVGARFGAPSIRYPCSGTESDTNSAHLLDTQLDTLILAYDLGLRVLGLHILVLSRARTLASWYPARC